FCCDICLIFVIDVHHPSISLTHHFLFFFFITPRPPRRSLFPNTTLFRSSSFPAIIKIKGKKDTALLALVEQVSRLWLLFGSHNRSEEHTSELQSRFDLVCRLLLEKKNKRY